MRCLSCDCNLNDFESTRKSAVTGDYIDLCNRCFSTVSESMYAIERHDLEHDEDTFSHGEIGTLDKDTEL
jgi:hypothetical protein